MGKPKFSAGTPPTACTREPPSLSPPKLDFQLQPIDLSDDPPVVSTVPSALRCPAVDQTLTWSLTRQMADEKAFREQRTKKTEAMLVSFLAKAKGAPPAVLEAWGISPSKEPSSPVRSVTARPEQPSSVSGKQKHKDRSSGNRDDSSPRRKGRDSRGSRTPQVDARVLAGAHNQPVRGRSRDPPSQRGRKEQSRGGSARRASPRRGEASSSRRSARGRSPHKRGGASRKDRGKRKEPSAYETFHLEGPRRASPKHFGRTHFPSPPRGYAESQYHTEFRSPSQGRSRKPKRSRKRKDRPARESTPPFMPSVSSEQEGASSRPDPPSYHDVEPLPLPEVFAGEGRTDRPRVLPEHTATPTITRTVTLGAPQDPYRRIVRRSPRFQRGSPSNLPEAASVRVRTPTPETHHPPAPVPAAAPSGGSAPMGGVDREGGRLLGGPVLQVRLFWGRVTTAAGCCPSCSRCDAGDFSSSRVPS